MTDAFELKKRYGMQDLVAILKLLRSKDGCPWDREQDHHSIRNNFLEETYEAIEAIDLEDCTLLEEELGDVLLQIVFHAQIEQEAGRFDFEDVCNGICHKLVLRHPHVFGETVVSGASEVLRNWEQIKQKSKGQTTASETLRSVPGVFPALMRSQKVQKRAAKAGFDYPDGDWAMRDLESELQELREAIAKRDDAAIAEELGDLLFSVVNVARFVGADAEQSLAAACDKFITRFGRVEELAVEAGVEMHAQSAEKLDRLWKQAKKETGDPV